MELNTYLFFDGNCREAFERYESVLDGNVTAMMRYAEAPAAEQMPAAVQDRIMHACLDVGGFRLMGSDVTGDESYEGMRHVAVTVTADSPDRAREIFDALGEGGAVQMAFGETFFARAFGAVSDRYGVSWMVICE